jgi:hypothetical protein
MQATSNHFCRLLGTWLQWKEMVVLPRFGGRFSIKPRQHLLV